MTPNEEAIFEECALIALEQRCERRTPWDLACVTIAEAIRLRASNRKTMDAIADATQGEQK